MVVRHRHFEPTIQELVVMSRGLLTNRRFGVGDDDSRTKAIDKATQMLGFLRDPASERCWIDVSSGEELASGLCALLRRHNIPTRIIGTTYREISRLAECWQRPAAAAS